MSERVEILVDDKKYSIRPPSEQRLTSGLAVDDSLSVGHVFQVAREKMKEAQETLGQLHTIINDPNLAIVDSKILRLTGSLENLISQSEVVGPKQLMLDSEA